MDRSFSRSLLIVIQPMAYYYFFKADGERRERFHTGVPMTQTRFLGFS